MVLHCYDSVTAEAIPPAPVVLGYVDGAYTTYPVLRERFRGSSTLVVGVTTGAGDADIIDVENGDATPEAATTWCIQRLKSGRRPTVYGTRDSIDAVVGLLRRRGVRADLCAYFLADFVQVGDPFVRWPRGIPAPYAGWQFAASVPVAHGHSVDASVVSRRWARRLGWKRG